MRMEYKVVTLDIRANQQKNFLTIAAKLLTGEEHMIIMIIVLSVIRLS